MIEGLLYECFLKYLLIRCTTYDYLPGIRVAVGQTLLQHSMYTNTELPLVTTIPLAVEKFYDLNDDMLAVQATTNRVFFEFLRTKPAVSVEELDILWSVSDLLATICSVKPKA